MFVCCFPSFVVFFKPIPLLSVQLHKKTATRLKIVCCGIIVAEAGFGAARWVVFSIKGVNCCRFEVEFGLSGRRWRGFRDFAGGRRFWHLFPSAKV